jgi:RNA polymerase sigma-70 factor (family 1)
VSNIELQQSWTYLLNGEERGISGLYDSMWHKLYTYAARILQDKSAAADVIQDLFIKLWEKRAELSPVVNVEGFLFKSLKHAVLNYLQSTKIRDKHLDAFCKVYSETDNLTMDGIYQKELMELIKNSSESLPIRMKEIFLMNRFEHKTVSEIAKELNLSEQTVRNQINLALKKIRPSVMESFSAVILLSIQQLIK